MYRRGFLRGEVMESLAKLNFLRSFVCCAVFFIVLPCGTQAQSTLEYATLTSSVAAAAKAGKEKIQNQQGEEGPQASSAGISDLVGSAMTQLYGESNQVLTSKAGALLGQVGGAAPENLALGLPKTQADSSAKVYLKDGRVVQGKIAEQTEAHVKIDLEGITVTFFREEIDRIE
jgi:hypothetical protein